MMTPHAITVAELVERCGWPALGVVRIIGDTSARVRGVNMDSRRVHADDLFACVSGDNFDGSQFAADAVQRGATAVLTNAELDLDVAQIIVNDVRHALGPVAATVAGNPSQSMRVVGVTGTNGKSTVVHLLEAIYQAGRRSRGTIGTIGITINGVSSKADFTTPEAPELQSWLATMSEDGVTDVAMEVSSHALAQGRVAGTTFAAVGFTNLSHDHLDYHGDLDSYFAAKAMLFTDGYSRRGVVFVDSPWGKKLAEQVAAQADNTMAVTKVGTLPDATLKIEDVLLAQTGTTFTLREATEFTAVEDSEPRYVSTSLLGSFNVANAAMAIGLARAVGIEWSDIFSGISGAARVPGRMEPVELDRPYTVVVDFAHTPDGLTHVLSSAQELTPVGQVICVFGCGGDRDKLKRPLMGTAVATHADVVIVTSDNPRSEDPSAIIDDILTSTELSAHPDVTVQPDRRRAIAEALLRAQAGDMVVVAGKGHETGQIIGKIVVPFDDRDVVRAVAEEIAT